MIMKLVPLLDHSGHVKAWADRRSGWICNLAGNVFARVAFDGVFNLAGAQIGWWYGDHLRDRYGRVVLSRRSTKIEGLNMPRSEKIRLPPKVNLPSGHPVLRWLLMPPLKRHEWADIKSLFDRLAQIRAYEEKAAKFSPEGLAVWLRECSLGKITKKVSLPTARIIRPSVVYPNVSLGRNAAANGLSRLQGQGESNFTCHSPQESRAT
jgi:hypothetical protein